MHREMKILELEKQTARKKMERAESTLLGLSAEIQGLQQTIADAEEAFVKSEEKFNSIVHSNTAALLADKRKQKFYLKKSPVSMKANVIGNLQFLA